MIRPRSMLPIGFLAAAIAALLSTAPVTVAHAGNGGDSEEDGTPVPDPSQPDDGDESSAPN